MRIEPRNLPVLAAALFGAVPANAQIAADPASGVVTCATQPGRFLQRPIAVRADGNRLAGRIRLVQAAPHRRWVPAAGFLFTAPEDRNAGVQIALSPSDRNQMLVGLRLPGEPELIQLGALPANIWIPVSVSLEGDLMTVTVGRNVERRRVRLAGPIEPVIHCNSGTFEFRLDPGMRLAEPPADAH